MSVDEPERRPARVSVRDTPAFVDKYLADLGQEEADLQVCHWPIESWHALEKRITGPEFECGGHRWRILLFPFGNSNGQPYDMVSVYLDYADGPDTPPDWHVCAQFALVISNPDDPTLFSTSQAHHRFTAEEMDWGFTRFNEFRKLVVPADARARPIIENDRAVVSAFVRVLKDPTGVLWHNFINYDSKKETGFVGMKNQGATCYMNSLLQSLFFTNDYRRAVYQIPTEGDVPSENVALALQRVFYLLQTSDVPVGTTELTRSFGWKSLDSFLQHDVQEFNRVLQEKLEAKMKGTAADGAISRLFVGRMKSYVKCINIDFESARSEDFYDIQLNVKGMRNLEQSFADYIQTEVLDGDNMYHAEGFGLQPARKGVIFERFPPVLHLQLKRFEYDMERDTMVKINDRHEFGDSIDLAPFVEPEARGEPWRYRLHGVLVHSGDLHGGHYFALIRPERDSGWFKFDDDRVTPATEKEVYEDNYGGEILSSNPALGVNRTLAATAPVRAMKRFTNAYMLVYVRESEIDNVLRPFGPEETPAHLRESIEEEREQLELRRRERAEQHLYMTVKVVTAEHFREHQGFDLAAFDDGIQPATDVPAFRVLKNEPFVQFKARLAAQNGLPVGQVRLWAFVNRQNKTVRPDAVVPDDPTLTLEGVRERMTSRQHDLRLFLEVFDPASLAAAPLGGAPAADAMLIFLKHFDTSRQTLHGVSPMYVRDGMRVGDLVPTINELMRWPPTTQVKLFEEIKPGMIEQLKPRATFYQSEIKDGDVVCFQIELSEKDASDYEAQSLYANPIQFYDYLQNQVRVLLKPKDEESHEPEFELVLSKKMTYDALAARVGERLGQDPFRVRFTAANGPNGTPKTAIKRSTSQTVNEIIQSSYLQGAASLLYYERLDVSIIELETKRALRVIWMGAHNHEDAARAFLLPKTASVHELAEQLARELPLSPDATGRIRVFEVAAQGKQQRELPASEFVGTLPDNAELFAEQVWPDELAGGDDVRVVTVCHFYRDIARTHSVPFRFAVRRGERFADTRARLQARLRVPDAEFAKYRFALVQLNMYKQPAYLEDDDVLFDHRFLAEDVLGIDHVDRSGRASRYAPAPDRGIRIRS